MEVVAFTGEPVNIRERVPSIQERASMPGDTVGLCLQVVVLVSIH